jgi:hypothetical protein
MDGEESLKTRSLGGYEWNVIFRDKNRQFTPIRYTVLNVAFVILNVVAYTQKWGEDGVEITTNWQPAAVLLLVGAGHIFGFFTNQSKVKKLEWEKIPGNIP